ncbi:MAG TPA: hypothetical protein VHW23_35640 [Kofleriaceae bacterium]|jgi:hypothetical protein|nr:hypothetical protein [Kofleriaceae bacterium]
MHARGWIIGAAITCAGLAATAAADPAPKPVDVGAVKAQGLVLQDAQGGIYVVFRGDDPKIFYGPNARAVYEQHIVGSSSDGEGGWEFNPWSPRVANGAHIATLEHKKDGTYQKSCGENDHTGLTELSGEKAHAVLDKAQFLTMAIIHVPHLLARDDSGVYYYVDRIAKIYGGKGYRVFVGRKGAMKPMPLTDVASDSAGEVFSTKSGDLRLVRNNEDSKQKMTWVKGGKRTELVFLDTDDNSVVIFKDLGIYTFLGTLCDDV